MKLGVFDRLILLNILPKEGDYTTLKIVRKLREDLSFTEEEHKALQFRDPRICENCGITTDVPVGGAPAKCPACGANLVSKGSVKWKTDGATDREYEFGEKAQDIIVTTLKKISSERKLTEQHIPLYEKFVT